MMERIFSYAKADAFFRDLAEKNADIKDYCGTSADELANKLSSVDGVQSPILVFYGYRWKLSGNEQRTFNTRILSFAVFYNNIDADDFDAQRQAKDDAEAIGLEVLSRIYIMSKMPEIGWLYKNFEKETALGFEAEAENVTGMYGFEFHFELKVSEPLIVTPAKWSDGTQFCSP